MALGQFLKNLASLTTPESRKANEIIGQSIRMPVGTKITRRKEFSVPPTFQRSSSTQPTSTGVQKSLEMTENHDLYAATVDGYVSDATRPDAYGNNVSLQFPNRPSLNKTLLPKIENFIFSKIDYVMRTQLKQGGVFFRNVLDLDAMEIVSFDAIKNIKSGFALVGPLRSEEDPRVNGGYFHVEIASKKVVNFFYWYEVTPFFWKFDYETNNCSPLFSAGANNYIRLNLGEKSLAVARDHSIYPRIGYELKAGAEEFDTLITKLQSQRVELGDKWPEADVFSNGQIKMLNPTAEALARVEDIKHATNKAFLSTARPRALFSTEGTYPNRSVLDRMIEAYMLGPVDSLQKGFMRGVNQFIDVSLWLKGIDPQTVKREWRWAPKVIIRPEIARMLTTAYERGDVSRQTFLESMGFRYDEEQKRLKKENADNLDSRSELTVPAALNGATV